MKCRFLLSCNEDSCLPDSPPADLPVCADSVLDFTSDCILDLTFDTQDPEFAIMACTEEGNFCDEFCDVEMDAWSYDDEDPTLAEAAEALRTRLEFGVDYSFSGEGDLQSVDPDFLEAANAFAGSSTPLVGRRGRSSIPFANVDAFHRRVFLLYPETNTIVSLEEVSFFG